MDGINVDKAWVTFCMTTYKRPQFLRNQLRSLQQQTFTNFKVIISDNDTAASGDAVVKEINDPRISYSCNEENLGMVKSFNKSLARADTEYIVMITDDDPVYPEMLQTLYDLSLEYPGYGMYYGGCDRTYSVAKMAQVSKAKVGTNSQLANLDLNTVRCFSAIDFPLAYLHADFGGGIFWSVGIVKTEIALKIGSMPDYGTPNMADCGFIFLSGSEQGAVFINVSLGYQFIHEDNYSYNNTNFKDFSKGVNGFYEWIKIRLPQNVYNNYLDKKIKDFVARLLVSFFIFVKKNIQQTGNKNDSFEKCVTEAFNIPFMRKWKIKYWIGVYLPFLFPLLVSIKTKFFK
jgi:glycosyltransferase involved in cell wall biosynthesis